MVNTNIGKSLTSRIAKVGENSVAEAVNSFSTESYEHYLNLKSSAEWLDTNSHHDLATVFKNFAEDISENWVRKGDRMIETLEKKEKGFTLVTERQSKSEIVRRILRRNIFETRHLIGEIRNKFRSKNTDEWMAKKAGNILKIYEQQLFWLKIFLKHRSEKII